MSRDLVREAEELIQEATPHYAVQWKGTQALLHIGKPQREELAPELIKMGFVKVHREKHPESPVYAVEIPYRDETYTIINELEKMNAQHHVTLTKEGEQVSVRNPKPAMYELLDELGFETITDRKFFLPLTEDK